MNLKSLIHEVWKDERVRELGIRKDEIKVIVTVVLDQIIKGLIKFGKVKMHNFATLDIRKLSSRKIANPKTGEHMYTKDSYKIGIEPSKQVREQLKNFKEK